MAAKTRALIRAKEAEAAAIKAAAEAAEAEDPATLVTRLHFNGIKAPQQYVDRMGRQAVRLARLRRSARGGSITLGGPREGPYLSTDEILIRELDKLEPSVRAGIVSLPQYNGVPPPRIPPSKPWETCLPGLMGNESNWREWELGGRREAEVNPWNCGACGACNRPLYAAPGWEGAPPRPERCEVPQRPHHFDPTPIFPCNLFFCHPPSPRASFA